EDKALASAWVESLYNNLAGRASDAEGLDFWTNAIVSFAMTPAQVAASFAAALALQGNTTEDGQNFAAKLGVADNFTANFKDFKSLVTVNEKSVVLGNLVTLMNGVNKDSEPEQYTEEIRKITDEYQNIKAIQFTTSDEDDLGVDPETGEVNTTSGVNFTGTYNITDSEKGTIQSSDSATGNPDYLTDTLTVNVTGYDKTAHDTFNLNDLPNTTSVEKLVINNGAATVSGDVGDDFEYINVNGTGSFDITTNNDGLKDVVLNSALNKDNLFSNNGKGLVSFKSAAGNDNVTLGTVSKSFDVGAGNDEVNASLGEKATGNLGAGDDKFNGSLEKNSKLNAGAGDDELSVRTVNYDTKKGLAVATVEIDGGTGEDTLDLSLVNNGTGTPLSLGDGLGIKSIKGVEKVIVGNGTTLFATAISGQKIEFSSTSGIEGKLILDATNATNVDLTKFTNADGENVAIHITNVKSGNVNLETVDKTNGGMKETITLSKDAANVSIKGFDKSNDKIAIEGAINANQNAFNYNPLSGKAASFSANIKANTIFEADISDSMTLKSLKDLGNTGLGEKEVFYILSYDQGNNPKSTANLYKVEVGKNGNVANVVKMATVNVANKEVIDPTKDVIADQDIVTPITPDNITGNTLTIPADVEPNVDLNIDLSTLDPQVAASISTIELPKITAADKVPVINIIGAKSTGDAPVAVTVAAGSVIKNITTNPTDDAHYTITVPDDATVEVINLGNKNDEVIAANSNVKEINTYDGNDTITLNNAVSGKQSTITKVDGGDGIDALMLENNAGKVLSFMNNIEKIGLKGTSISASALNSNYNSGVAEVEVFSDTGASHNLEVFVGTNTDGVNLTNLYKRAGDTIDITVKDIKDNNTIFLSSVNDESVNGFKETVELGTAKNVYIENLKEGDVVTSSSLTGITEGRFAELTANNPLGANKALFKTDSTVTTPNAALSSISAQLKAFTTPGSKAIVAVNGAEYTYVFEATAAASGATTKLLAVVTNAINVYDVISGGAIVFSDKSAPATSVDFSKLASPNIVIDGIEYAFGDDNKFTIDNINDQVSVSVTDSKITPSDKYNVVLNTKADYTDITGAIAGASGLYTNTVTLNGNKTLSAALTNVKTLDVGANTLTVKAANLSHLDGVTTVSGNGTLAVTELSGSTTVDLRDSTKFAIANATITASGATSGAITGLASGSTTLTLEDGAELTSTISKIDALVAQEGNTGVTVANTVLNTLASESGSLTGTVKVDVSGGESDAGFTLTNLKGDGVIEASYTSGGTTLITAIDKANFTGTVNVIAVNGVDDISSFRANQIDNLYAQATNASLTFTSEAKLNANGIALDLTQSTAASITLSGTSGAEVNLGNQITANSDDTIAVTVASGTTKLTATDGKDTIDLGGTPTTKLAIDLTETAPAVDVIDLQDHASGASNAAKVSLTGWDASDKITFASSETTLTAGTSALSVTSLGSNTDSLVGAIKAAYSSQAPAQHQVDVITVNIAGKAYNGTYLVYNSDADASVGNNDIVVQLIGNVAKAVSTGAADGSVTLA
ncbi:beta strand repeat-containing protein, partial [Campylobacter magnus]